MSRTSPRLTRAAAFDFDVVSDTRPIPSRKPDPAPEAVRKVSAPETSEIAEASSRR